MRRSVLAVAAAIAVVVAVAAASLRGGERTPAVRAESSAGVFAWSDGRLVRVDPVTLRAKGRALAIEVAATAFSRDQSMLAAEVPNASEVRVIDLRRMRIVGPEIDLGPNVFIDTMQWLDARTIAAVAWGDPPHLLSIEVPKGRVVERRELPGVVIARARTRDALVVLVGPRDRIGASTLVVADAAHGVRSVRLDEVRSGFAPIGGEGGEHRQVVPGLAVDPTGRRAVVVPPGGRVAEIALESSSVAYHELVRPASLLGRLRDWLEPPAHAKSVVGPERQAYWVGEDAVAVVALEQAGIREQGGEYRQLGLAAGVELIDTRTWSVRSLSDRAGGVAVAAETLLVYGGSFSAGGAFSAAGGPTVTGLRGFAPDGEERFSLFGSRHIAHVQTAGRYAYVRSRGAGAVDVLDAATGHVVGTARTANGVFILAP